MFVTPARFAPRGVAALMAVALVASVSAQEKKEERKLKDAERQQGQTLVRAIDHAMTAQTDAGTAAWMVEPSKRENGITAAQGASELSWRYDALKAQEGKIYVPFTVELPQDAVPGGDIAMYVRVVPKGGVPTPAADQKDQKAEKDDKEKQEAQYPFEDLHFTRAVAGTQGKSKVMRALAVPAGQYDVYVAMMSHAEQKDKKAPVRVITMKQPIDVPDFWNNELNTSSVIVADKVEGLSAPLTPEQQRERPYVLGQTEIVPAVDATFGKNEELTVIFQIYNPVFENKKPDVTVEYVFYRKEGDAEKPFNKMAPQQFNAQTLPPQFDPDMGFQIAAGWSVPLQSFPEGDYKLHIKVQDNKSQKSVTRDVLFTVTGA